MSLEVKRKEKENPYSLLYRFSKAIQESRYLAQARKSRYSYRRKSHSALKLSALKREEQKKVVETLKKLGKLPFGRNA